MDSVRRRQLLAKCLFTFLLFWNVFFFFIWSSLCAVWLLNEHFFQMRNEVKLRHFILSLRKSNNIEYIMIYILLNVITLLKCWLFFTCFKRLKLLIRFMNLKWLIYQLFGSVFDDVHFFSFVFKSFQPIAKHNQPNKIKIKIWVGNFNWVVLATFGGEERWTRQGFSFHNRVSYHTLSGCHPRLQFMAMFTSCWGFSSLGLCSLSHSTMMLPPVTDSSLTGGMLNPGLLRVSSCVRNLPLLTV